MRHFECKKEVVKRFEVRDLKRSNYFLRAEKYCQIWLFYYCLFGLSRRKEVISKVAELNCFIANFQYFGSLKMAQ